MSIYKNILAGEAFRKFSLWNKQVNFSFTSRPHTNNHILEYYFAVKITADNIIVFQYVKSFSHVPTERDEELFWEDAFEFFSTIRDNNDV